jgi:hypothetical protein
MRNLDDGMDDETGRMDGKDDPPRTKPSLLYKKINALLVILSDMNTVA